MSTSCACRTADRSTCDGRVQEHAGAALIVEPQHQRAENTNAQYVKAATAPRVLPLVSGGQHDIRAPGMTFLFLGANALVEGHYEVPPSSFQHYSRTEVCCCVPSHLLCAAVLVEGYDKVAGGRHADDARRVPLAVTRPHLRADTASLMASKHLWAVVGWVGWVAQTHFCKEGRHLGSLSTGAWTAMRTGRATHL